MRRLLITLVVIAGASLCTTPAQASLGRVVVMGDSYSSGTGLGPQLPGSPPSCDRTTGGYAEVAMRKASHGDFINETCNGAKTQALFYGYDDIREQTAALDGSEKVVILGIGGNNAQFGDVAANCLIHEEDWDGDVCANSFGSGAANTLPALATAAITTTQGFAPSVSSTLDQIHAKSPQAKIFLVGYLRIAPPDGATCNTPFDDTRARSYLNLTPTDAPVFAAWEDAMQAALVSEAAGRSFVHFVNMQPASIPHNACTPASQRWVNSLPSITPDTVDGLNLHPSSAGAAAVASALLDAMVAAGLNLGPEITIGAPTNGSHTTAATTTLTYTATSSLGTPDCTPASGTSVGLNDGLNTITVSCSDPEGNQSSASVSVSRGSVPGVAITAPSSSATHTTAVSVNVAFTVNGSTSIPAGTTCTVNGTASSDSQSNAAHLTLGDNTITVSCTNAYGAASASIALESGIAPSVAIVEPISGSSTTAATANVSFTVGGSAALPPGTTCAVNDAVTASLVLNAVQLVIGANSITVSCSSPFGSDQQVVDVTRELEEPIVTPPTTTPPTLTPPPVIQTPPSPVIPLSVAISAVSPSRFSPLKRGNSFSRTSRKGSARVRVTLGDAADIRMRIEQLSPRKRHSGWSDFRLPSAVSTLYISGRASKRALSPGRYRVRLAVRGTSASYTSRSFQIAR